MRLFVALDVPDSVRRALADLVSPLRELCRAARWVRLEGAHVTLKFIGHVSDDRLPGIQQALAQIHAAPFDLRFAGLGFFPSERRPRVFWAGIEAHNADAAPLASLAESIEVGLFALGIAREERKFSPHLTLARFESSKGLDRLRAVIAERQAASPCEEFGAAHATEFFLYQSVLKRGGAEYTRLAAYPLSGGSAS